MKNKHNKFTNRVYSLFTHKQDLLSMLVVHRITECISFIVVGRQVGSKEKGDIRCACNCKQFFMLLLSSADLKKLTISKYRTTSLCKTCLSQIHSICRSEHPFPSISPILLCFSNLFMSNSVITKYRSGFSFPKRVFRFFTTTYVEVNFCVGQKIKQYECQTK